MTLLTVEERAGFRRELDLMLDKGKDENKLRTIVEILKKREPLPRKYRDHKLRGRWEGYRGRICATLRLDSALGRTSRCRGCPTVNVILKVTGC